MNSFSSISSPNSTIPILFDPLLPNPEVSNTNTNLENWTDWIQTPALPLFMENNVAPVVEGFEESSNTRIMNSGNLFEPENSFSFNDSTSQIQSGIISRSLALGLSSQLGNSTTTAQSLINPNKYFNGYNSLGPQFEGFSSSTSSSSTSVPSSNLLTKDLSLPLNFISPSTLSEVANQAPSTRSRRSAGPSSTTTTTQTTNSSLVTGKPSQQADEAIPEAALHLLRLGLASNASSTGTGSVATTNTTVDDDASCDEDAEGESDATSFHSDDERSFSNTSGYNKDSSLVNTPFHSQPSHSRSGSLTGNGIGVGSSLSSNRLIPSSAMDVRIWNYGKETVQIPIVSVRGGPQSVSSSRSIGTSNNGGGTTSSTRVRQHRPARAMSNAGSNRGEDGRIADSPGLGGRIVESPFEGNGNGRRTSGRVRKTVLPEVYRGRLLLKQEDEEEMYPIDSDEDRFVEEYSSDEEGTKKKKGKGKAKARRSTVGIKRSHSSGLEDSTSLVPPPKRIKVTKATAIISNTTSTTFVSGPRVRRQRVHLAPEIPRRTFAPRVEINNLFPRFYRSFPVSRAFHPESFVNRLKGVGEVLAKKSSTRLSDINDITTRLIDPTLGADSSASTSSNINVGAFTSPQHQLRGSTSLSISNSSPSSSTSPSTSSSSQFNKLPAIDLNPVSFMPLPIGAVWNKTGEPLNLYQPRFIKGTGEEKAGLCPICVEPPERGGEGEEKWLKNSTYVYHASYYHGISNLTGLPFSPPTQFRVIQHTNVQKDARVNMVEGLCHKCNVWIQCQSVKNVEAVIPEIFFWKHAKKCHGKSNFPGESDIYVQDNVLDLVNSRRALHTAGLDSGDDKRSKRK